MGVGTCFTIRLPVVSAKTEEEEHDVPADALAE